MSYEANNIAGEKGRRHPLAAGLVLLLLSVLVQTVPVSTSLAAGTSGETTGGAANTWTNYSNAGGAQGPTIPAFTTVQITCAVTGFRVADGNTWWYQIAQAPWNNAFYVSADAFYNNGRTSGSLLGTPFVDPAVPICGSASPPPPVSPSVSLAQGPVAPAGFRYAINLDHFAANRVVTVSCYDTVSPNGFYSFTMTTDGAGHAFTQGQCYSSDGPDHWVVAGGVQSNHAAWGGPSGGGGGGTPPPGGGGVPPGGACAVAASPSGNLAVRAPSRQPSPRPSYRKYAGQVADVTQAGLAVAYFGARGYTVSQSLASYYLGTVGAPQSISMGDLIWQERPLWAVLENNLRSGAQGALGALKSGTSACSSASRPFDSGWMQYTATKGDWANALHTFSVNVKGVVWIGPADASGVRQVRLQYRVSMFDVYDFDNSSYRTSIFNRLYNHGLAAQFLVTGSGLTRYENGTTSTVNFSSIGLNW